MDALQSGDPGRRATLGALGASYVALSAWMFSQERAMRRSGGPGIVGLEFAGSTGRVEEILAAWGTDGRVAARRSLLIDYGVLASYGPLMFILCRGSAERQRRLGRSRLARLGSMLAAGQLIAALCDVGENSALLMVLAGRRGRLPALAKASAGAKFSLLGVGCLYVALDVACRQAEPRRCEPRPGAPL
jgi:hypothetical protein